MPWEALPSCAWMRQHLFQQSPFQPYHPSPDAVFCCPALRGEKTILEFYLAAISFQDHHPQDRILAVLLYKVSISLGNGENPEHRPLLSFPALPILSLVLRKPSVNLFRSSTFLNTISLFFGNGRKQDNFARYISIDTCKCHKLKVRLQDSFHMNKLNPIKKIKLLL